MAQQFPVSRRTIERIAREAKISSEADRDRLGPYASADLYTQTLSVPNGLPVTRPALVIRWPDQTETEMEHSLLEAIVVPVPVKLRLPMT